MTANRAERFKHNLILFGICGLFVLLGGRLYFIQVVRHESYKAEAKSQTAIETVLPAPRGDITDRNGRRLALSVPAYTVAASLPEVRDPVSTARKLAPIMGLGEDYLLERLRPERREVRFVYIKRKVPVAVARRIEAARAAERERKGPRLLRGVHLLPDSRRAYTCGSCACHVLGFTQWRARSGDTGQEGVERALDGVLRGTPGRWELLRDGGGRALGIVEEHRNPPEPGYRVVLTIDLTVQRALERHLAELAEKYRPRGAFGLVLEPHTGRVLALASWPNFDPNRPGDCPPGGRLNRILTTVFEPGSTFKPIVAAGALEAGVFKPGDKLYCERGAWRLKRRRSVRTITDAHPYGWLTFADAVVKSSNIGLAKVGRKLGARRMEGCCRAFGFGRLTGLGIPGESHGLLRPLPRWTPDSVLSIPFGHEISVTPLQLISAYGAIANGGVLYRPQLVRRIEDAGGNVLQEFPPVPVCRVISRKTSETMREILRQVVERGTGRRARVKGCDLAGKTGTARKLVEGRYSDRKHYSSFVGFAPAGRPRAAALITVDEPRGACYGGAVAGPAVGALVASTLAHTGAGKKGDGALASADERGGGGRR